jgi:hypothetical protein
MGKVAAREHEWHWIPTSNLSGTMILELAPSLSIADKPISQWLG